MPRLVDVEALKLPDEYQIGPFDGPYYRGIGNEWNSALQACREHIDSTPTLSPDEVRGVGKWMLLADQNPEDVKAGNYAYWCSRCYARDVHAKAQEVPYCWRCGARMEGADDGTTD